MDVQAFYNKIPYPLRARSPDWAGPLAGLCRYAPKRILHAGCATGSQTVSLGNIFPEAEVVGVDFAESSLAMARKRLEGSAVGNVRFELADLTQPLDRFGEFDLILSYGVLHHIPQVDDAMSNLRARLATPESALVIFLYGKHGRARIAQLQQALSIWQGSLPDLDESARMAALWAAAKSNGTFAGPRGWIKHALVRASSRLRAQWVSSNADAYLNPFVRYYDMGDILDLLARHDLALGGFVERAETSGVGYPVDEEARFRAFHLTGWNELSRRTRYEIVDRLAAPKEYEFVCFPAG